MARYALTDDGSGEVVNVIEADEGFDVPDGFVLVDPEGEPVDPGDVWDGSAFNSPEPDPIDVWDRPGAVDEETRDVIAEQFRAKGGDAISALDAIEANADIPAEVAAYLQASFAMQYLTYVSLMGEDARIEDVEARFFGDSGG